MSSDSLAAARPLSPYTIVEVAAPRSSDVCRLALAMAGKIAADLGATVIKIVPRTGDPLEVMPVLPYEEGQPPAALAAFLNSGKSLLGLDLDAPEDRAVAEAFAAPAQAILTDGPLADGPQRVVVQVAPLVSPDSAPPPMSELTLLALSGLLDIVGEPSREPLKLGGHQAAYAAGFAAFSAMMTGLAGLEAHGECDTLDVAALDVLTWINWKGVGAMEFSGVPLTRQGERAEWRTIPCKDGYIALVFEERNWPALAALIGDPVLADPALASHAVRAERRGEYMPAIAAWCAERTREEVTRAAQSVKVPIGPVVEPRQLRDEPHVAARRSLADVDLGDGRRVVMPRVPAQWNGAGFATAPARAIERRDAAE